MVRLPAEHSKFMLAEALIGLTAVRSGSVQHLVIAIGVNDFAPKHVTLVACPGLMAL